MLLPDLTDSTGTVRHLVIGAGKDGNIYLVTAIDGQVQCRGNQQIWQQVSAALPVRYLVYAAYFKERCTTAIQARRSAFARRTPSSRGHPSRRSQDTVRVPGTASSVSANGTAMHRVAHENPIRVLHALDAANLGMSCTTATKRRQFGIQFRAHGNKFITPTWPTASVRRDHRRSRSLRLLH